MRNAVTKVCFEYFEKFVRQNQYKIIIIIYIINPLGGRCVYLQGTSCMHTFAWNMLVCFEGQCHMEHDKIDADCNHNLVVGAETNINLLKSGWFVGF